MISSLGYTAKLLVKRPQLILIPLGAAVVFMLLLLLIGDIFINLLLDTIFLKLVPETGFFEFPLQLYMQYFWEFNILTVAMLVMLVVFTWIGVFFSSYAREAMREEESILQAMRETNSLIKQIITIVLFFFLIGILLLILLLTIVNFSIPLQGIGLIFPTIFFILTLLLYITLLFVVAVTGIEKAPLKVAIQKSFDFSSRRILQIIVLSVLVGFINSIILGLEMEP